MSLLNKLFTSPMALLRVVVALCYMAMGIYLIVDNALLYFIDRSYRPILAVVFIIYGAYRLYRAVSDLRNE